MPKTETVGASQDPETDRVLGPGPGPGHNEEEGLTSSRKHTMNFIILLVLSSYYVRMYYRAFLLYNSFVDTY